MAFISVMDVFEEETQTAQKSLWKMEMWLKYANEAFWNWAATSHEAHLQAKRPCKSVDAV